MLRAARAHVVESCHRPKKGESPYRWGCDFTCRQRPTCCAHGISRWHVAHSYPRWIIRTAHHVHRSVLPNLSHGNQPLPIARVMLESFCRIEDGEDITNREASKHTFDSSKVHRFHVRRADPHENVSSSQTFNQASIAAFTQFSQSAALDRLKSAGLQTLRDGTNSRLEHESNESFTQALRP